MSGDESKCDVAIVGGSYAGLALALALDSCLDGTVSISIIERSAPDVHTPARPDPRAFAVTAGSRHLFEAIGVWPAIAAEAEPVVGIEITDSGLSDAVRPVLLSYDNIVDGSAQTHIVDGGVLRDALLKAVWDRPAVRWIAPADLVSFEGGSESVQLGLGGAGAIRARVAVAADGGRSRLRDLAGIGVTPQAYGQVGIVATVGIEKRHNGRAVQHFLPGGPFALLPLTGNRFCVTWSEGEDRAKEILAMPDDLFLEELQQRAGWRFGELSLEGERKSWPIQGRLARDLVRGRVALIGDAARSVHPIAGQGLNLGLRDVAALSEAMVEAVRLGLDFGDATALARYQRWRRFDNVQSSLAFGILNSLFSNDWALLRSVRSAGLGVVERLAGLKSVLVAEAAGQQGDVPLLLKGELP
ncbi:MAG: FAD-dependent monooxygenase [Hyphomicrobiaceae bacterium]